MSPTVRQLGMKLKQVREARGMKQDAVAKKAGITREYLSRLEAGRYDPTVGVLQRLAKALKVKVTELLE